MKSKNNSKTESTRVKIDSNSSQDLTRVKNLNKRNNIFKAISRISYPSRFTIKNKIFLTRVKPTRVNSTFFYDSSHNTNYWLLLFYLFYNIWLKFVNILSLYYKNIHQPTFILIAIDFRKKIFSKRPNQSKII